MHVFSQHSCLPVFLSLLAAGPPWVTRYTCTPPRASTSAEPLPQPTSLLALSASSDLQQSPAPLLLNSDGHPPLELLVLALVV